MILFKKHTGKIIYGKVIEEKTKIPISRSTVTLLTIDGTQILATLKTNKLGEFYYNNPQAQDFKFKIEKEGFEAISNYDLKFTEVKKTPVVFSLKNKEKIERSRIEIFLIYVEDFLGMLMEALILFEFLVQLYFIPTFGFLRIAPFLIITVFNLILVFVYLYKPRALEE